MKIGFRWIAGALLCLGLLAPVSAHAEEDEAESTIVEELVVVGVAPGPPWWRVSSKDSTIDILVVPPLTPTGMIWDTRSAERRIGKAHRLILPPRIDASFVQMLPAAVSLYGKARTKTPLEDALPADLRERYLAARRRNGDNDAKSYWRPKVAASMVERAYRSRQGLARNEVLTTVKTIAKRHKIKLAEPEFPFRDARPALDETLAGPPSPAEQACLSITLETMDRAAEASREAALDWAKGDARSLLALPAAYRRPACSQGQRSRELYDRGLAEQIRVIEEALTTPGSAVAIVPLGMLVSRSGVLETLKARGYDIRTPANID